jgi:hypothetical protein
VWHALAASLQKLSAAVGASDAEMQRGLGDSTAAQAVRRCAAERAALFVRLQRAFASRDRPAAAGLIHEFVLVEGRLQTAEAALCVACFGVTDHIANLACRPSAGEVGPRRGLLALLRRVEAFGGLIAEGPAEGAWQGLAVALRGVYAEASACTVPSLCRPSVCLI